MKRFSALVAFVVVAGCGPGGPPDIRPPWAEWPSGGETEKGIRLHLQTARTKYVKGRNIWLRARIENAGKRRFYLDTTADWAEAFVELNGPSGRVPVVKKDLDADREFKKFMPGDASGWEIANLKTDAWEIKLPLEVGKYKATLVCRPTMSRKWNRLAVAGGKYEGQFLWLGEARSNEVVFEVVAPEPRKK